MLWYNNTKTSKQYIGSSLNLYSRLMDHIKGRESNLRLQRSIHKDGLSFFKPLAPAWDQGEGEHGWRGQEGRGQEGRGQADGRGGLAEEGRIEDRG